MTLTTRRLGWLTVAAFAALTALPHVLPGAVWLAGIVAGAFALAWICRAASPDPALGRLALWGYGARVALTLVFYAISAWQLPVFESLHFGPGFWFFAPDALRYHERALDVLQAWQRQESLYTISQVNGAYYPLYLSLSIPLAFLYAWLGAQPVHALLLMSWLGAMTVVPAYALACRLGGRVSGRWAAGLVAFWPSAVLWSSQLLRDTPNGLAMLMFLASEAAIIDPDRAPRRGIRRALPWLGLAAGIGLVTYFRVYMGYLSFLVVLGIMTFMVAKALPRKQWASAGRAVASVVVAAAAIYGALAVDLVTLCSPPSTRAETAALGRELITKANPPVDAQPIAGGGSAKVEQVLVRFTSLDRLNYHRQGMVSYGGGSVIDPDVRLDTMPRVIGYLPRALQIAFLAPFPSQWFRTDGATGAFRLFSSFEMVLIYLFLPAFLAAGWSLWRRRGVFGQALVCFIVVSALALTLTVANLGIHFRLRMQYILPMLVGLAIAGWPRPYRWAAERLRGAMSGPLGRNFSSLLAAQVWHKACLAGSAFLIASALGSQALGRVLAGMSFAFLFWPLLDAGLAELFVRDVAGRRSLLSAYAGPLLKMKGWLAAVTLAALWAGSQMVPSLRGDTPLVLLLGGVLMLESYAQLFRAVFRIQERMSPEAALLVLDGTLKLAVSAAAVLARRLPDPVLFIASGWLAVGLVSAAAASWAVRDCWPVRAAGAGPAVTWTSLLRRGLPLAAIYALGLMNARLAIVLVNGFLGPEAAGQFGAGERMLEILQLAPLALANAFLPVSARLAVASPDELRQLAGKMLAAVGACAAAAAVTLAMAGGPMVRFVLGPEFGPAASLMAILSWAAVPLCLKPVMEKLLSGLHRQDLVWRWYAAVLAGYAAVAAFVIPSQGMAGAAACVLAAELAAAAGLLYWLRRHLFGARRPQPAAPELAMELSGT